MAEDAPQLVAVVLHVEGPPPQGDGAGAGAGGSPAGAVRALGGFAAALEALHPGGAVALFGAAGGRAELLWESGAVHGAGAGGGLPAAAGPRLAAMLLAAPRGGVGHGAGGEVSGVGGGVAALPAALGKALCYVRRVGQERGLEHRRVLVVSHRAGGDAVGESISTLNAVFCAQRAGVVLDCCVLGPEDSPLLQQAAHSTGGIYARPPRAVGLFQSLLSLFLADLQSRPGLELPAAQGLDSSAACFCHRRPLAVGHVCSVCLSVFCEALVECPTCGTTFDAA